MLARSADASFSVREFNVPEHGVVDDDEAWHSLTTLRQGIARVALHVGSGHSALISAGVRATEAMITK